MPLLFLIFIHDIGVKSANGRILRQIQAVLLSPSLLGLQYLVHKCEDELNFLDMRINSKKAMAGDMIKYVFQL